MEALKARLQTIQNELQTLREKRNYVFRKWSLWVSSKEYRRFVSLENRLFRIQCEIGNIQSFELALDF